jgi:hypothetical protein
MRIGLTGDWAAARRLLEALGTRAAAAMHRAVLQEAHAIRGQIVQGLVAQAPAGAPFKPLAALTVAARQLAGFGGTKALLRRGDLLGSITVVTSGGDVFIGVARTARAADGRTRTSMAPRRPSSRSRRRCDASCTCSFARRDVRWRRVAAARASSSSRFRRARSCGPCSTRPSPA